MVPLPVCSAVTLATSGWHVPGGNTNRCESGSSDGGSDSSRLALARGGNGIGSVRIAIRWAVLLLFLGVSCSAIGGVGCEGKRVEKR